MNTGPGAKGNKLFGFCRRIALLRLPAPRFSPSPPPARPGYPPSTSLLLLSGNNQPLTLFRLLTGPKSLEKASHPQKAPQKPPHGFGFISAWFCALGIQVLSPLWNSLATKEWLKFVSSNFATLASRDGASFSRGGKKKKPKAKKPPFHPKFSSAQIQGWRGLIPGR